MAETSAIAAETADHADQPPAAAERIAFLALASELARERNVLVVDDGASALTGVAAHLDSTDLTGLADATGGAYDLVVADITSYDETAAAGIAELTRIVTADSGTALVRLPQRQEFAPLLARLKDDFARSLTLRQHNWVSSALFDDAMFVNDDPSRAVAASVRKLAGAEPQEALYDVVVATHGDFPSFRPQLALTRAPELRRALLDLERAQEQAAGVRLEYEARLAEREARVIELEKELAWYDENQLAVRATVEESAFASALLGYWVFLRTNLGKLGRLLGS